MEGFTPTKDCPKLPSYLAHLQVNNPFPQITNDDVDLHLSVMLTYPGAADLLPTTQYGRRIAVKFFLKE